jgi:4'-phosphopantetheinyl transferase EntD
MKNDGTLRKIKLAAASILPVGCVIEVSGVEVAPSFLSDDERALMESWALPRQQEFVAGRLCARRALEKLGQPAMPLLRDADGLPIWPTGVLGSITHCRGIAAAALRRADGVDTLLGLDLEKTNRLSERARRRVLHPCEVSFAGDNQVRATVLFSLKEAFYKAQFPRWRTPGNFQDIGMGVDMDAGRALVTALDARFNPGLAALQFRFSLVGDYVLSLCCSHN